MSPQGPGCNDHLITGVILPRNQNYFLVILALSTFEWVYSVSKSSPAGRDWARVRGCERNPRDDNTIHAPRSAVWGSPPRDDNACSRITEWSGPFSSSRPHLVILHTAGGRIIILSPDTLLWFTRGGGARWSKLIQNISYPCLMPHF